MHRRSQQKCLDMRLQLLLLNALAWPQLEPIQVHHAAPVHHAAGTIAAAEPQHTLPTQKATAGQTC